MSNVNLRKIVYFAVLRLRGQPLGPHYNRIVKEEINGIPAETSKRLLIKLLTHCERSVPYYRRLMKEMRGDFHENPEEFLKELPILTKNLIRSHFDELKSADLGRRHWYFNQTSGSTGEPLEFIQDWEFNVRAGAITLLFSKLLGRDIGDPEIHLWGSMSDIGRSVKKWISRCVNKITNTVFLEAVLMTPERMSEHIDTLNAKRPKLIISYSESIHELAIFAECKGLKVIPQKAIITSAATLYPFMRERIERVFGCKVFNRYGSREMGDIACERPGCKGLWVAPWGNYVEIVDDKGNRVPDGEEGEILVTSLSNYAMPLVRYSIGDRGLLLPVSVNGEPYGQVFGGISGRDTDTFRGRGGLLIHAAYFGFMVYSKSWISQFQVVQKSPTWIVFRIVKSGATYGPEELTDMIEKTKAVLGSECKVEFDFVTEIPSGPSGKLRHLISEVRA